MNLDKLESLLGKTLYYDVSAEDIRKELGSDFTLSSLLPSFKGTEVEPVVFFLSDTMKIADIALVDKALLTTIIEIKRQRTAQENEGSKETRKIPDEGTEHPGWKVF